MSDELKCKCSVEKTTGWTQVKCCNICGLPVEGFWKVPGMFYRGWQKEKPTGPCYMVHRYKRNGNKPDIYDVDYDDGILCVFNIQDDEFSMTLEEFVDEGEFYIIEK